MSTATIPKWRPNTLSSYNVATKSSPSGISMFTLIRMAITITIVVILITYAGLIGRNWSKSDSNYEKIVLVNETLSEQIIVLQQEIDLFLTNDSNAQLLQDLITLNETKISTISGVGPNDDGTFNVELTSDDASIVITPNDLTHTIDLSASISGFQQVLTETCVASVGGIERIYPDGTVDCKTTIQIPSSDVTDFSTAVDARITLQKGVANGLATLDGSGMLPASQLSIDATQFLGNWNAATNTPTIVDGDCPGAPSIVGDFYTVSTPGSTTINGNTDWITTDWLMCGPSGWLKNSHTNLVTSVNGDVGAVNVGTVTSNSGSSTDNALTRFHSTSGEVIQESVVILSDTGDLSGINDITLSGTVDGRDVAADGTTLDNHVADTDIHVAHSTVTITGDSENNYIIGGGDITASRTLDIDTSLIQRRVSGSCTTGQAAIEVESDGTLICQNVGTVTSGSEVSVDNTLVRMDGTSAQIIQSSGVLLDNSDNLSGIGNIALTGTVDGRDVAADGTTLDNHVADADIHVAHSTVSITGDVSGYITGGGDISASRTLDVDTTLIQRRVSTDCADGYIQSIAQDGTATCAGSRAAYTVVTPSTPDSTAHLTSFNNLQVRVELWDASTVFFTAQWQWVGANSGAATVTMNAGWIDAAFRPAAGQTFTTISVTEIPETATQKMGTRVNVLTDGGVVVTVQQDAVTTIGQVAGFYAI